MSRNRLIFAVAIAALLGAPVVADAQTTTVSPAPAASTMPMMGPGHHHHHHRHHRDALMHTLQALDLTAAQKQQVATFRSQEQQANMNADTATRHANMRKMHDQIMGILTPDQTTRMHAMMDHSKMHHSMMHSGSNMMAPGPSPAPSPN